MRIISGDAAELLPRCRFPRSGTAVTCAVSGGADSTALLALAVAAGLKVTAAHVDHALRPESASEATLVRDNATRLGARFVSLRAVVERGANLEERARIARYGALPADALLGHTADDQAETVLLNALRGSGLHGLGGMRADDGRRPILRLRRVETRDLCVALKLAVAEDASNHDPSYRRNRIRHEVLPLLDSVSERDVVPLLCRLAAIAREASDHLDAEASTLDVTDAAALREAPPLLARLAIRSWLKGCDELGHPPGGASIERVLGVARLEATATDVGRGWEVRRSGGVMRLERP